MHESVTNMGRGFQRTRNYSWQARHRQKPTKQTNTINWYTGREYWPASSMKQGIPAQSIRYSYATNISGDNDCKTLQNTYSSSCYLDLKTHGDDRAKDQRPMWTKSISPADWHCTGGSKSANSDCRKQLAHWEGHEKEKDAHLLHYAFNMNTGF